MSTNNQKRVLIISAAVVAISLLYFFIDARATRLFPKCPFHLLTGLYCPGCGSQRAFSALLHLDLLSAVRFNVLLVAGLPLVLYSATAAIVQAATGKVISQRLFHQVWFIRTLAVIVVLYWILRNIPAAPFNSLAPHH